MIDLTARYNNFAVYLPALQKSYALATANPKPKNRPFPKGINMRDLDFLNAESRLWHYGYALYSAGQFTSSAPIGCSVQLCRDNPNNTHTTILGDSGGYQIGKGTLKGMDGFKDNALKPDVICRKWRNSGDIRKWIVNWLEANSHYAMTLDMPLWAKEPSNSTTPFHHCSIEQLIDLSVENLKFIKNKQKGNTKWLSVLQGTTPKDSKQWWDAVKPYRFSGWALAGNVGWRGGIDNVLYYTMLLRDEGGFELGQEWMHVLGVSQPKWAVALSAIQRGIRKHCNNPNFRVSFDSASPFQLGGRYQRVARYPKFGKELGSWVISAHEAPINASYFGEAGEKLAFPFPSPLGDRLRLSDLNVYGGDYTVKCYDDISGFMLTNHNCWVYVRSFLEANELAFRLKSDADKAVPQHLLDLLEFIENLLSVQNWEAELKKHQKLLHSVFPPKKDKKKGKADAEEVEEVEERSTEEDWVKQKDGANVRT